jgi:hypothetical protein
MFQHFLSAAKAEDEPLYGFTVGKVRETCARASSSSFPSLWSILSTLNLCNVFSIGQPPAAVVPYAQPYGLSDDITQWLSVAANSQVATCKTRMFANINIEGATPGTVVASTSTENPDYHYNCECH